jgi:arsenate reductase
MKTVLFVCVHNAGRSQIAEAFFNQLANGKAHAISASTQPADKIDPVVVGAMLEAGLDISLKRPRLLTLEMLHRAKRVITMGCMDSEACPAGFVPTENWGLPDPRGFTSSEVIQMRDIIKERVILLLKDL